MRKLNQSRTDNQSQHHIAITLNGNRTADFYYSDLVQAQSHYEQLRAAAQLGGVWINSIKLNQSAAVTPVALTA